MTTPQQKNINNSLIKMNSSMPTKWFDAVEIENATFQWVNRWNETRPHKNLDYRTPIKTETEHENTNHQQDTKENNTNTQEQNPERFSFN